jgi:hypothetical protein
VEREWENIIGSLKGEVEVSWDNLQKLEKEYGLEEY